MVSDTANPEKLVPHVRFESGRSRLVPLTCPDKYESCSELLRPISSRVHVPSRRTGAASHRPKSGFYPQLYNRLHLGAVCGRWSGGQVAWGSRSCCSDSGDLYCEVPVRGATTPRRQTAPVALKGQCCCFCLQLSDFVSCLCVVNFPDSTPTVRQSRCTELRVRKTIRDDCEKAFFMSSFLALNSEFQEKNLFLKTMRTISPRKIVACTYILFFCNFLYSE